VVAGAAGRTTKDNPGNYLSGRDFSEQAGEYVAPRIYGMSDITPNDIDVAGFYDCFTFTVISQLEAFGFVKKGEGGSFVEAGNLRMGGTLPSNTAGGHLSEGYTQGVNNIVEVVRQLRHEYEGSERQVVDADVGLCTGFGGPQTASGLVLERGQ
jgi:acetyl-CoA acetyltransferase